MLPEGTVCALQDAAQPVLKLLPQSMDAPSAATEWRRLSVLLKLLFHGKSAWGSPQNLYGLSTKEEKAKEEEEEEQVFPRSPFLPQSAAAAAAAAAAATVAPPVADAPLSSTRCSPRAMLEADAP